MDWINQSSFTTTKNLNDQIIKFHSNNKFNLRNKWAQTEGSAGELINSNLLKAGAGIHLLSFNILQPLLVNQLEHTLPTK